MRYLLALWICKVTTWLLRAMHRGATALPGKLALSVCPDILARLASQFTVYVVTGTNGKTTTGLLMSSILEQQGVRYISNKSGSNLERGIVACFAEGVKVSGQSKGATHAVIECDEAAFAKVAGKLNPAVVVVTNFFKDQLDRYGQVTATLNLVKTGAAKAVNATLVLNADDPLCASIGRDLPNNAIYYGMDNSNGNIVDSSHSENEAGYCLYCHSKMDYAYNTYGHLGSYACNQCGYSRPTPQVEMTEYSLTMESATFSYRVDQENYNCSINMSGLFNIYNAMGAIGMGLAIGVAPDHINHALSKSQPGFGRMETVHFGNKAIRTILVKNSMGLNQVINYLISVNQSMTLCFAVNDHISDGEDISWLWDVNLECLSSIKDNLSAIYTCGIRGADMAVRLKYAGLDTDVVYDNSLDGEGSIPIVVQRALEQMEEGGTLVVLPSYSAMLAVRSFLQEKIDMKEFWN